jgi:hypothetical protein
MRVLAKSLKGWKLRWGRGGIFLGEVLSCATDRWIDGDDGGQVHWFSFELLLQRRIRRAGEEGERYHDLRGIDAYVQLGCRQGNFGARGKVL